MSKINKKSSKSFPSKAINKFVYISLLVIIPLLLNWKNISYEFSTSDDTVIITKNYTFLSDFKNVLQAFTKDNFIRNKGENYYRPIQTVSFMIDAQFNGEKPYIYHFSNILYHILTVIVLFFLLIKLGIRGNISFFLSLLFSVHPLFTDAIVWIPGRGDLLAGLFCSISFLSFIYYQSTKEKLFFVLHSASFMLALFSKEISVFLPVVLIFYYWFVLKNKYNIRALIPFILVWCFSVLAFYFLRYMYVNSQVLLSLKAFITSLQVIPIFLSKLIIPLRLSSMPVYDTLFTGIGLILFISSGIYLLKTKRENKSLIILGLFWFLGFIIPAMFADLPLSKVHFDYLECRAYVPSIGIFITLGALLNEIVKRKGINILVKSFMPVVLIFSIISYIYSGEFADADVFYSSLIKSNPGNAFALSERGSFYLSKNNFDRALADFDNSIKIYPYYSLPYFKKGVIYINMNDHIRAEHFFSAALNYDTLYPEINYPPSDYVYVNLSIEKINQHQFNEALVLLRKAIKIDSADSKIYNILGIIYFNKVQYDSAYHAYSKAIELEPNSAVYYNNRGRARYSLRDYIGAFNDFSNAVGLSPDYTEAYFNMGVTKLEMGDNEGAISNLSTAIKLKSDYGAAYYYRGIAYGKINKPIESKKDNDKALSFGYR